MDFLLIILICFLFVFLVFIIRITNQLSYLQNHLRQVEKKIDNIHSQIRMKDYTHPSAYPFETKNF